MVMIDGMLIIILMKKERCQYETEENTFFIDYSVGDHKCSVSDPVLAMSSQKKITHEPKIETTE